MFKKMKRVFPTILVSLLFIVMILVIKAPQSWRKTLMCILFLLLITSFIYVWIAIIRRKNQKKKEKKNLLDKLDNTKVEVQFKQKVPRELRYPFSREEMMIRIQWMRQQEKNYYQYFLKKITKDKIELTIKNIKTDEVTCCDIENEELLFLYFKVKQ